MKSFSMVPQWLGKSPYKLQSFSWPQRRMQTIKCMWQFAGYGWQSLFLRWTAFPLCAVLALELPFLGSMEVFVENWGQSHEAMGTKLSLLHGLHVKCFVQVFPGNEAFGFGATFKNVWQCAQEIWWSIVEEMLPLLDPHLSRLMIYSSTTEKNLVGS